MGRGVKPQVVEILAPDHDSPTEWVGSSPAVGGASERAPAGGSRTWIAAGAVVALLAVVIAVAVTSGGPDSPTATPQSLPASSVASPSTGPRSPTTSIGPGGEVVTAGRAIFPTAVKIVPTTPAGFRVADVNEFYPFRATERGARQLWADQASDSPAPSDPPSWFEIDASDAAADDATGIARLQGRHGVITVVSAAPGWVSLIGAIDGGSASVTAAEIGLARAISVLDAAHLDGHVLRIDPSGIPADFELVATTERNIGAQGTSGLSNVIASTISYVGDLDSRQWIGLTAGGARPSFDAAALQFRLHDRVETDLGDGRLAEVFTSTDPDQPDRFVRTEVGGVPVEIAGNAPVEVLVEMARSARVVSDGSWIILQHQAHDVAAPITSNGPLQWQLLASGVLADGTTAWSLDRIDIPGTTRPSYAAQAGGSGTSFTETGAAPAVQMIALAPASIVVARMPRDEPGAKLEVTVGGVTHVADIVEAGAGVTELVGVVALEGLGIPSARIVDAGGAIRATGPVIDP